MRVKQVFEVTKTFDTEEEARRWSGGGCAAVAGTALESRPYVIIRGAAAGVHAGELESLDRASRSCVLRNARRIWFWKGAASLSELAVHGTAAPSECKFGVIVERQEVVGDVCEVIYCHDKGAASIRAVPEWRV